MFTLFVDADSLPLRLRKIILQRAMKENMRTIFVADRNLKDVCCMIEEHTASLRLPLRNTLDKTELRKIRSSISMLIVESGTDSADNTIVQMIEEGDIVISHDVGLSERAIGKGAVAIDDRGNIYTRENMKSFREMGINDLNQKSLKEKDYQKFSNSFDALISKKI